MWDKKRYYVYLNRVNYMYINTLTGIRWRRDWEPH